MADYFSGTNRNTTPSWWPNYQGTATTTNPATQQTNPLANWDSNMALIRDQNASRLGTSMPAGGVAGGHISANGFYWVNPDGTQVYMGNKAVTDPNVDQSYRNIGKGDLFSGTRDGWNWVAGNRTTPDTGNAQENLATLHQFGYRPYRDLGVQGNWMGNDPLSLFRSEAGWAQRYTDQQLRDQIFTITQNDLDRYSPEQRRRIQQILGDTRPDLRFDTQPPPPVGGNPLARGSADPYAAFRRWQAGRR